MSIEKINPRYLNLVDKLFTLRQVYRRAADRTTDHLLKDQLEEMASRKDVYIRELAHLYDLEPEDYTDELKKRVEVELDKTQIEINYLILEDKQNMLIEYCLNHEKEIIQIYKRLINFKDISDLERTMLKSQLNESNRHTVELRKVKEPYDDG